MATILLGWEFGSGLGHVTPLLVLAQALKAAGHRPVLALANIERTRSVWDGQGIEVLAAPGFMERENPDPKHETLADVMVDTGVFTVDRLAILSDAWGKMLAQVRPHLVVCDFAPTLAFHARGRLPIIVVGSGYSTPPAGRPFPLMRFWKPGKPSPAAARNEKHLFDTINATAARLGVAGVEHASDILGGDEVFVRNLPELDCYGAIRRTPAIGSLTATAKPARDAERAGLFGYLVANPDLPSWIAGIARSGLAADLYVRGVSVPSQPSIQVHDQPVDVEATLPGKRLVMHHGGTLAEVALRIGLPQLLIPRTLDQGITGKLVARLGGGELIVPATARDPLTLGKHIARMARDDKMQARSLELAKRIAARQTRPALDIVVEAIGKYI